jgi:hypothetical protein
LSIDTSANKQLEPLSRTKTLDVSYSNWIKLVPLSAQCHNMQLVRSHRNLFERFHRCPVTAIAVTHIFNIVAKNNGIIDILFTVSMIIMITLQVEPTHGKYARILSL